MHPYEMATTMRTRGEDESIKLNYGSLYTVVESLARKPNGKVDQAHWRDYAIAEVAKASR